MSTPQFYLAKVLTIGLVSIYYALLGTFFSIMIDKSVRDFDPVKQEAKNSYLSDLIVVIESGLTLSLIGMSYYLIRKVVKTMLPQPFEGVAGFQSMMLKEISGGIVIAFVIFQFQLKLQARLHYLYKKYGRSMPLY